MLSHFDDVFQCQFAHGYIQSVNHLTMVLGSVIKLIGLPDISQLGPPKIVFLSLRACKCDFAFDHICPSVVKVLKVYRLVHLLVLDDIDKDFGFEIRTTDPNHRRASQAWDQLV